MSTTSTSPASTVTALTGHGIGVRLGPVTVLDDVDVEVRRGEVLALVGPNGAGKSTLLAVLAGDLAPTAGRVEIGGRPLDGVRLRDLARERSVLTQENRVSFPFPAVDVVRMGRAPWRGRPEEDLDDVVVADALDLTATTALADRSYGLLSGGEKGRVSFARVLAQQTPVVLLDEPTAALDLGHQEAVLGRARTLADAGCAVVVVLHDLSLAAAWSDRVVLLAAGRVVAEGPATRVFTADLLSRVYDHPVDVLPHPVTGELLVLPDRARRPLEEAHR
jgi:iron complex transport system ATP-binding protein